jgi:hypothetical protein
MFWSAYWKSLLKLAMQKKILTVVGSQHHSFVWISVFYMYITIIMRHVMCFNVTKFHYKKYNFITPLILLNKILLYCSSKPYLKLILKSVNYMYKIWKSWIVIQRTGQMPEAEASAREELWDMCCIVKYLHLATTLLSSS